MPPATAEADTLRDELAHEAGASGPERRPQGQFALTRDAPCQQHVRHVRTRDEQHHPHGGEQHQQRGTDPLIEHGVVEGLQSHAPVLVRGGELLLHCGGDAAHLVTCAIQRDAGTQPADHADDVIAAILARRIDGERDEDLRAASGGINLRPSDLAERARHDADDLMTFTVQGDGLPDNRRVAAEAPPPELFRDHRHTCGPRPLVFGAKAAAGERLQAEHAEHRRGDRAAGQALRLTMAGEGDIGARERRERFHARRTFCPREIVERRDAEHRPCSPEGCLRTARRAGPVRDTAAGAA